MFNGYFELFYVLLVAFKFISQHPIAYLQLQTPSVLTRINSNKT